ARSIRRFEYRYGFRQEKGIGIGFSRVMVPWAYDLQMTELRFDCGLPKIEENPLDKTIRQNECRNAKRDRSHRDRATAPMAHDITEGQIKVAPEYSHNYNLLPIAPS
ncbi:MAG: hypothetical protein L0H12_02815, partial [Nitrosospira sp.]|nr:hypothetical protein [Nitrosospira sp.]